MDESGNVVAAWIENGVVMANTQPFGGSWGMSATAVSSMGASELELVVDAAGNATAIWNQSGVIEASTLPLNGMWSTPVSLSSSGSSAPQIAVDSSGNLAAIWVCSDVIQAATQAFGMSWSSSTNLSFASFPSDSPQIAIGNNQTIVAVWHSTSGGIDAIFSTSTTLGTSWPGGTSVISDTAFSSIRPHVAVNSQGLPIAVWYRFALSGTDYSNVFVQAAFGNADTTWNPPMDLTSPAGIRNPNDLVINVAFNQSDVPFAIWTMGFDSSAFILQGATFMGGAWIDIPYTSVVDMDLLDQNFMISAAGNLYAAFMSYDPNSMLPSIRSFKENTNNTNPNFGNILTVSTSDSNAFPRIDGTLVNSAHSVATVWLHFDQTSNVVQASVAEGVAISAPTSVSVTQGSTDYGVYTEYFNTLSWSSLTPDSSSQWIIYRNGVIIQILPAATLSFIDHNAVQNQPVTYGVALQTQDGDNSSIVTASLF
jgi:hypothetical protein